MTGGAAIFDLPDGSHERLQATRYGSASEVRFGRTTTPGVYRLHVKQRGQDRVVAFSFRPPREESDLTQLTDQRWRELETGLNMKRIDPTDRPLAAVVAGTHEGFNLWPWAVMAVLGAAVIEIALARSWSMRPWAASASSRIRCSRAWRASEARAAT